MTAGRKEEEKEEEEVGVGGGSRCVCGPPQEPRGGVVKDRKPRGKIDSSLPAIFGAV